MNLTAQMLTALVPTLERARDAVAEANNALEETLGAWDPDQWDANELAEVWLGLQLATATLSGTMERWLTATEQRAPPTPGIRTRPNP
jgi:hypothetical protein